MRSRLYIDSAQIRRRKQSNDIALCHPTLSDVLSRGVAAVISRILCW